MGHGRKGFYSFLYSVSQLYPRKYNYFKQNIFSLQGVFYTQFEKIAL